MKKGKMTGAKALVKTLERMGVEVIFGYPGGANLPIYKALRGSSIRHILAHHEQGAAHMADGYARVTGKIGVCLATSGPGATNLVTGIATAYMDSSPIIAITGQVPSTMIGNDAFQEVDTTGITIPITKHNYLVQKASEISHIIEEAFYLASTGRRGPVLVDIPKDIQNEEFSLSSEKKYQLEGYNPTISGHPGQIKKAVNMLNSAEKPLVIAGGGIFLSEAFDELKEFIETSGIPLVHTLMGKSAFSNNHPLNFGMFGYHGKVAANTAVTESDCILAVGTRFGDRSTWSLSTFAPNSKLIHIDIDPAEISKNVEAILPIVGDAKNILPKLASGIKKQNHSSWINHLNKIADKHPLRSEGRGLSVPGVLKQVDEIIPDHILVTDVGRHQMFAALYSNVSAGRNFVTSGGLGTMGFGLPAALGAKVGRPEDTVVMVAGDGSFTMTCQEIATAAASDIPVVALVMNDSSLGMIKQLQDEFYDKSFDASMFDTFIRFDLLAESLGGKGYRVETKEDLKTVLEESKRNGGITVIDCIIKEDAHVYPMVTGDNLLDQVK